MADLLSPVSLGYDLTSSDGIERGKDGMPTAIRLFKAGVNETTQGDFLFDELSARAIIADAKARGIDYAFDLEHLSIDKDSPSYDPDARGWFRLELRAGELWAVVTKWTPDGLRRLSEQTQKYISPTFLRDAENRVRVFANAALVADPATYGTPALVAAHNRRGLPMLKNHKSVAAMIATLSARAVLAKAKMVKLADAPADGADAGPKGKGAAMKSAAETVQTSIEELLKAADGNDIDAVFAAMDAAVKAMDACENAIAAMTGAPKEPAAETAPAPDAAVAASAQEETKLSRQERAELVALKAEKQKRDEDEQVVKLAAVMTERTELKSKLVKLGRETPATAEMLNDLPIEKLRERVKLFEGIGGAVKLGGPRVPVGTGNAGDGSKDVTTSSGVVVTLTANQLRECERTGAKPEAFAELQARRTVKA